MHMMKGGVLINIKREDVIFKSPANAMKKFEGVGGMLYLTKDALIHQPHRFNVQKEETYISLDDIEAIEAKDDYVVLRNKITVFTREGRIYHFRVQMRKDWLYYLNQYVN